MKRSLATLAIALSLATTPLLFADDGPDAPKGADEKKGDDKKDDKKDENKKDDGASDLDALTAKALAGKLHVPASWNGKDGTVDLTYDFSHEDQLADWKVAGADKVDLTDGKESAKGARGKGAKGGGGGGAPGTPGLRISVSSDALATAILDPIELKGDFTIETTLRLAQFGPSCDFVFLVGFKGKEATGIRFGDQYVKVGARGITAITHNTPSIDKFTSHAPVKLKIQRKGNELKTWIDGIERPAKTLAAKDLDGKVGILASNNVRVIVARFQLKGAIDRSKL
jgi:hypothetical protein